MGLLLPCAETAVPLSRSDAQSRRVLIVAPHFPPTNAPDHQRVRLALPGLAALGWQAEVLAVDSRFVDAPLDPELASTLPRDVQVHRTSAIPIGFTRPLGWSSLARRAFAAFRQAGDRLLASGRFDLVFFSTSQFGLLPLGPYWERRYHVPFVVDLQDEWVSTYFRDHPEIRPPGGRFKYAASQWLACRQERQVLPRAARIVSVSARYHANLRERYPEISSHRLHVLPFGAAEGDFERLRRERVPHDFFRRGNGLNWVYVGRGGPGMRHAASAFFAATRRALDAGLVPDLRLHFIGTDYATGHRARETFLPLARDFGLEGIVRESTARVPHFTALQCLLEADALIVPGVDDPGYNASKISNCLLAERPLLALFHAQSGGAEILRAAGTGTLVTFTAGETPAMLSDRMYRDWFKSRAFAREPVIDRERLRPLGAGDMTRRLARIFDAACRTRSS
jgi:glycosyltransferase involved in cell wall biosynthesis